MYTDLDKLIKDKNILLTEGIIKGIMLQVVEGLRFLHGNWIMHRVTNKYIYIYIYNMYIGSQPKQSINKRRRNY